MFFFIRLRELIKKSVFLFNFLKIYFLEVYLVFLEKKNTKKMSVLTAGEIRKKYNQILKLLKLFSLKYNLKLFMLLVFLFFHKLRHYFF